MVAEGSLTYIHINFTFSLCYTKGEHSKWEKKWPMTVPSIPDIGIEVQGVPKKMSDSDFLVIASVRPDLTF